MKKILFALSLSSALLGGSVVWAEDVSAPATENITVVEVKPAATTALTPEVETDKEPTPVVQAEETLNTGDTAWILISTALVLLMTIPGLALFYGGMVRKKKCPQYNGT